MSQKIKFLLYISIGISVLIFPRLAGSDQPLSQNRKDGIVGVGAVDPILHLTANESSSFAPYESIVGDSHRTDSYPDTVSSRKIRSVGVNEGTLENEQNKHKPGTESPAAASRENAIKIIAEEPQPPTALEIERESRRKEKPQDERLLLEYLMLNYERDVRPVRNGSIPVVIMVGITLTQIFDFDEKNQVLTTNVWLDQEWVDELLVWEPELFGGLDAIRLPCHKIWLPDIVLYNNADDYSTDYMRSRAMIEFNGKVFWPPPTKFRSTCPVDVTFFPFDDQKCKLKLGSWTYNGFQVDVTNRTQEVDLSNYVSNGEWELLEAKLERNVVYYSCCPEPFPDVTITLTIRRKTLYYIYNIVLPCIMLSVLTLLVFCLPPDSGEKIALGITVLLAFSVFMLAIAEKMPETSTSIPLIGIYLTCVMGITSVSVVVTVILLNLHYLGPRVKPVPDWLKWILPIEDKIFIRQKSSHISSMQKNSHTQQQQPQQHSKGSHVFLTHNRSNTTTTTTNNQQRKKVGVDSAFNVSVVGDGDQIPENVLLHSSSIINGNNQNQNQTDLDIGSNDGGSGEDSCDNFPMADDDCPYDDLYDDNNMNNSANSPRPVSTRYINTNNRGMTRSNHTFPYQRSSTRSNTYIPPPPPPPSQQQLQNRNQQQQQQQQQHNLSADPADLLLYNRFNNTINTQQQVEESESVAVQKELIRAITKLISKQVEDQLQNLLVTEWRLVAKFIDRILFVIFLITTFVSSFVFLVFLPLQNREWYQNETLESKLLKKELIEKTL